MTDHSTLPSGFRFGGYCRGAPAVETAIKAEQIRQLNGTPFAWPVNLVAASVAAWILRDIYTAPVISTWLGVMAVVIAARLLAWVAYIRSATADRNPEYWGRIVVIGAFLTGCVWSPIGMTILHQHQPLQLVFILFVIGGMTAGAAVRDTAYLPAFYAFVIPILTPTIVVLLEKGGEHYDGMAILLAVFGLFLLMVGHANAERIIDSLRMRAEQDALIGEFERVHTEAALRDSETALKDAQRLAHVGSWVWDAQSGNISLSEELYHILRMKPGRKPPSILQLAHLTSAENMAYLKGVLNSCMNDGAAFKTDLAVTYDDGTSGWVSVHGESVRDESGTVTRLRGTVQDITDRKLAEQHIAALHHQMSDSIETLKRHDMQMRDIARMSDMLQACHTRSEAFPIISSTAQRLFPNASGALALIRPETRQFETATQWGQHPGMIDRFSFGDCWALRTGRRYELMDSVAGAACHHFVTAPAGPYICLPMTVQGETNALLHISCWPDSDLDEDKQNLMTTFADVIKLSLANIRMREILIEQALRDQLTTLFNRHYLAETLPREMQRARREKHALSVAMLDLDHFKKLNDQFGHDAGDTVLHALGKLLRSNVRGGDIACRYGGEEFLLVLPDCNLQDARALVDNIRREVMKMDLTIGKTALPHITVSAGVAEFGAPALTAEALISAADHALYKAKDYGRNRVELVEKPAKATTRLRQV
jgi:diguanylate cyclase (GGDEF)-like protein